MRMLETGVGEPEVIEPVTQRRAGDRDTQVRHIDEVGQAGAPGLMGLAGRHVHRAEPASPPTPGVHQLPQPHPTLTPDGHGAPWPPPRETNPNYQIGTASLRGKVIL